MGVLSVAWCCAALAVVVPCSAVSEGDVAQATDMMLGYYNASGPSWGSAGWWHDSNVLEAIANSVDMTGNTTHEGFFAEYALRSRDQFTNELASNKYIDDLGWNALAWLRVENITGKKDYGLRPRLLFDVMAAFWDDECQGGVWWSKDKTYKNAIANELFFTLSTELYLSTGDKKFLTWAEKAWGWFNGTKMMDAHHLIVDGLTQDCNGTGPRYTYNQGVLLSGLANMYLVHNDTQYLDVAFSTAVAVTKTLSARGILQEVTSDPTSGDNQQFKGIFMRHASYLLRRIDTAARAKYSHDVTTLTHFLTTNAQSILKKDMDAHHHFGYYYQGPPRNVTYITHASGLDAITAAYGL
eukprot:TRINITY_DN25813_c0_g1_i1.p1 TRINITY_DN25813_c0_g1~~TRINITY_DN25813_c0_g1_i1.p1  ORF type:complete len:354 (+),score=110.61 TRINITY_DN25813_c0_g1_i1:668-1729(+)